MNKPEEAKVTPVLIKFESSANRNLHVKKDNSKQNKCGKSSYTGGIGSFPKVANDEILLFNCVFCEENFETEDLQEEHDGNNHIRDDKYFCPHPECTFQDEIKMKVMHHFTNEHRRGMTLRVCSLCKQGYLTTPLLRKHVLDAHGRDTDELTCPTCFETFPTINTINHHMGYEHIYGHFTCKASTCNKDDKVMEFETKAELDAHRKENHITLKSYTCELCGETITGSGSTGIKTRFYRHVQMHTMTEKKFQCQKCDKKFFWENELNNHWRDKHSEMKILCTQCDFRTRTLTRLKVHTAQKHSEERNYQCNICLQKFKTNAILRKHLFSHSDVKSFKCEFCGKAFKRNGGLAEHIKIHTKQYSAHCEICDKGFVQKYNLKLHNDKYHLLV